MFLGVLQPESIPTMDATNNKYLAFIINGFIYDDRSWYKIEWYYRQINTIFCTQYFLSASNILS